MNMSCLRRKLPALLLIALSLGIGFPIAGHADEIADLNVKARVAYAQNDYATAITCFDRLLQLGDRNAYLGRGMAHLHKGEFDLALTDLNEAVRLYPNADTYEARGYAWSQKGDGAHAINDFTEAIKRNPRAGAAYEARAEELIIYKQTEAAMADLHNAVLLLTGSTNSNRILCKAYLMLGLEYENQGNLVPALANYSKCLALDPQLYLAHLNRGRIYYAQGQYAPALADYQAAVRLNPADAGGYNRLAWLLAVCSDPKFRDGRQALANAHTACELTGWKEPACLKTYAAAAAETGDFPTAVKWQSQAITLGLKGKSLTDAQARLELYRHHQPYHDPIPVK